MLLAVGTLAAMLLPLLPWALLRHWRSYMRRHARHSSSTAQPMCSPEEATPGSNRSTGDITATTPSDPPHQLAVRCSNDGILLSPFSEAACLPPFSTCSSACSSAQSSPAASSAISHHEAMQPPAAVATKAHAQVPHSYPCPCVSSQRSTSPSPWPKLVQSGPAPPPATHIAPQTPPKPLQLKAIACLCKSRPPLHRSSSTLRQPAVVAQLSPDTPSGGGSREDVLAAWRICSHFADGISLSGLWPLPQAPAAAMAMDRRDSGSGSCGGAAPGAAALPPEVLKHMAALDAAPAAAASLRSDTHELVRADTLPPALREWWVEPSEVRYLQGANGRPVELGRGAR